MFTEDKSNRQPVKFQLGMYAGFSESGTIFCRSNQKFIKSEYVPFSSCKLSPVGLQEVMFLAGIMKYSILFWHL
jgi:hypothetical protein